MGGWELYLCRVISLGCKVQFPLSRSWKRCSWKFSGVRRKASVQSFRSKGQWVPQSIGLGAAISPLGVGSTWLWAMLWRSTEQESPTSWVQCEQQEKRKNSCSRSYVSQASCPCRSQDYFGQWLAPMCDSQVIIFPSHPDLTQLAYNIQPSFCFFPVH